MDAEFAQKLCDLNNQFYRSQAASFSDTRHNIWPGWRRCLEEMGFTAENSENSLNKQTKMKSKTATINCVSSIEQVSQDSRVTVNQSALKHPRRTNLGINDMLPSSSDDCSQQTQTLRLIDVACGNLRYEAFLGRTMPSCVIDTYALDACKELPENGLEPPSNVKTNFQCCDVIEELRSGNFTRLLQKNGQADLAVSFGFMHHIPLLSWRELFLNALVEAVAPGGYVCVSFWQFLNDKNLAAKAEKTTEKGISELEFDRRQFEEGDYLLGWKNKPGAYRYCHSFSDKEVNALVKSTSRKATLEALFCDDGRTGNMNAYLVLQKR